MQPRTDLRSEEKIPQNLSKAFEVIQQQPLVHTLFIALFFQFLEHFVFFRHYPMKIPLGEYDKAKTFPNAFIKIRFWHDLAVHDRTRSCLVFWYICFLFAHH